MANGKIAINEICFYHKGESLMIYPTTKWVIFLTSVYRKHIESDLGGTTDNNFPFIIDN